MTDSRPQGFGTFLAFWASQSVAIFGGALIFFALIIRLTQVMYPLAEQRPQLAFALAALTLAATVPALAVAPLAGAWVDRHDRKLTMIGANLVCGAVTLFATVLLLAGRLDLGVMLVLIGLFSAANAFHSAAFDTSYIMIVPDRLLPRANGMVQTVLALSGVISPALAAAIISLPGLARQGLLPAALGRALAGVGDGTALAALAGALTFGPAALALVFLRIPSPRRDDLVAGRGAVWSDVRAGAAFIWQRRPLLWLLGTFAFCNFAFAPLAVFQPLLVKFQLAPDWSARGLTYETALALLTSAGGLGGVAGGLAVSAWGGLRARRIYGILAPMVLAGGTLLVIGVSPAYAVTVAMVLTLSATGPVMNAHSQTIWQTQTPRQLQGRVFAVRRLIAQFSAPLGTALAGWAGGVFSPGTVVAVMGGLLALVAMAQLFNPHVLGVETLVSRPAEARIGA